MKKRSIFTNAPIIFMILIIALACEMGETIDEKKHEPNDSEEEATEITTYDSINGYIGENDVDFFEYDANRNYLDFTRLTVNNLETYNEIEARIFDEYMDEVEKLIGTQGENLNITFANTGGKYFIKLKSYNDKEGEYTMSVSDLDANDDFEPDNTLSQGREIDYYPTNEMGGTILTDSDYKVIDYECFQVLVRAGERVDFDILPSSSQTTLHLVVYNADKEIIAEENPAQGESITSRYLYNQGTSDVIMFLKLDGSVPHNGGDYRISFSETTYTGKKKGTGIGGIE
jgi:hypothetical protein